MVKRIFRLIDCLKYNETAVVSWLDPFLRLFLRSIFLVFIKRWCSAFQTREWNDIFNTDYSWYAKEFCIKLQTRTHAYVLLRRHVPSGLAGCSSFPPSFLRKYEVFDKYNASATEKGTMNCRVWVNKINNNILLYYFFFLNKRKKRRKEKLFR